MKKKLLKKFLNENGFFYNSMKLDTSKNAPSGVTVPEGAKYFEGVVSNGELNRNGYIIRPQALMDSLSVYMMNPIILLGHDTSQPVGRCLSAAPRGATGKEQEIFVTGYIFDDLTEGRFGRGLLNALSTGHITEGVEFENSETGEILSAEEFRKFNWEEQCNGNWIMAVTKLEWVEFSSVSIGSNRKSLITSQNAIEAFVKSEKFSAQALRDVVGSHIEDDHDEQEDRKPEDSKDVQSGEQTEVEVKKEDGGEETPAAENTTETEPKEEEAANDAATAPVATEEPAAKSGESDNAEVTDGDEEVNKIRISKVDREKLQSAADLLNATLEATIEKENDAKPEEKAEEKKAEDETTEAKEEEKPKEVLPGDEEKAIKPEEEKPEGNSIKIEVAPEVKNALIELVKLNTELTKEVAALELKLSKVPNIKGLAIVSQFNGEAKKKDNKPVPGEAILSMLQQCGFNV